MNRFALPLAFALLLSATGSAASPNPKDLAIRPAEHARALQPRPATRQRGFDERENAQDDLSKMGRLAFPALLEGLNSNPSPEVRSRCMSLITKASQADLQARLATFLADADGKYEHDMPAWNEFKSWPGRTP